MTTSSSKTRLARFRVTPDQHLHLQAIARQRGMTVSDLLRGACEPLLAGR